MAMEAATSIRAESERERSSQGEEEGRVERARKKHDGLLGGGVVGSGSTQHLVSLSKRRYCAAVDLTSSAKSGVSFHVSE
jgi:hypothetical protein